MLEEEVNKIFGTTYLNDEHGCNIASINSLNIHDDSDMQSHKLGDAMFDEDDIFSPPSFDEKNYCDDFMPPIYDDYIDESGFVEVVTLFNDESTILEEVSIDYDKEVAIYDDYGDDMYVIKNNDNHETCHHDFNFQSHGSILLSLLPLLFMRINLLMWSVVKSLCLWIMKRMLYVIVILLNSFMMLLKITMREEHMLLHISVISSFLSMC